MSTDRAGIFSRLDTVIVRVQDLEAARRWYEETLELTVRFAAPNIVVFDTGGPTSLTLEDPGPDVSVRVSREGEARSYPIFYTGDIEATHHLLASRGVKLESIKEDGQVRYFAFWDLEGNYFNVCHF